MLIIAGTFEVDPDRRDEFIAGREAGMRESAPPRPVASTTS